MVKNIIITGATRGLGLSHVRYLSKCNYNIALVDISKNACDVYNDANNVDEIIKELNGKSKID